MSASLSASSASRAPLWTAPNAGAATAGRLSGRQDWTATGLTFDSRQIEAGDLFIALQGEAVDGHAYVAAALEAGAVAAMVARRPEGLAPDAPLLEVDDPLAALGALGAAARLRATGASRVAVTGSVGKTSTKDMLARLLAGFGKTHAAAKSFNNHIGVPLTLARMPADTRFGVFEIGMNAPGEIAPLARLIRPDVAIVTSVAPVHTAAFADGVDGVATEKGSIVEGLAPGGVAILDRASPFFDRLSAMAREAGAEVLEFGVGARDAALLDVAIADESTSVSARLFGEPALFRIGAPGRHFANNALAALAAVRALGLDVARAALMLAEWKALGGRGARGRLQAPGGAVLLVDESYNANPASMAAALETFALAPVGHTTSGAEGRRIAFLTDMLELGDSGAELHAGLAKVAGLDRVAAIHCAGPLMAALHEALPPAIRGKRFEDATAMAAAAPGLVRAGDAVLVKGSLGSKAASVAAALTAAYPADE